VAGSGTGYTVYTLAGIGVIGLALTALRLAGQRIARWRKIHV